MTLADDGVESVRGSTEPSAEATGNRPARRVAHRPIVIGLTGGIACGKSTVAAMLGELGAVVIDADEIVHELQRPGDVVFERIVAAFGVGVLGERGELDRRALGRIVFADPASLARLEALIHPAVAAAIDARIAEISADPMPPAIVIEAVKLVEARLRRHCDYLWVIICSPEAQLLRLLSRGLDESAARARLAAQPDFRHHAATADFVIDNSDDVRTTRDTVDAEWRRLGLSAVT